MHSSSGSAMWRHTASAAAVRPRLKIQGAAMPRKSGQAMQNQSGGPMEERTAVSAVAAAPASSDPSAAAGEGGASAGLALGISVFSESGCGVEGVRSGR